MTVPTSDESVRTSGDSAWTVVDSVTVPTSRLGVDSEPIVHLQHDRATNPRLESLQLDRYLVGAGHQKRRGVDAGRIGDEGGCRIPVDLADRDLCAGYELAAGIDDRSDDASGGHLGGRCGEAVECDENEERRYRTRTPQ